ncbi:MAG: DUF134 domain-containing protein [Conexivisphaera sp.]|jgi:predicted DNA-binding protein (UPF0251 family)|nr:DUF134 domain-containing protein [Conexivisphaerales archaeon]
MYEHGWGWRRGRPPKPRIIRFTPQFSAFLPAKSYEGGAEAIVMTPDELEALRLVDYEGLLQEEAASLMGVSRGTVWRLVESGRRKLLSMVIEGRPLILMEVGAGGEIGRRA